MRIAMLGHKRVPSREGGVEVVVEELSVRMAAQGHQVTCYNRRGRHVSGSEFGAPAEKSLKGVRIKSVPTIDRRGLAAMSASFFASLFAAFGRYDVVHFHAEGPCATIWLPKLFGKKCVATIHGLDHMRSKWGRLARAYIMLGEKCAARFADEMIVLSRGNQEYFMNTYGRQTTLIPNGVNRPEPRPAEMITRNFGLEKDGYVLFLGRIVPEKGVHYLVEAWKNINTHKKLVIAGGASDSSDYFSSVKALAGDDSRIIFTDFVQGPMLEELYSNAYVYVLPSDLEGMPLSLLEALSYSNCCLTSDIPECADAAGGLALTFKRSSPDELRIALEKLLGDPQLVQQYKSKAASVCDVYNWDRITSDTIGIYQNIRRKK